MLCSRGKGFNRQMPYLKDAAYQNPVDKPTCIDAKAILSL